MRTFLLIDKNGTTYDITVKQSAFFYGVTGLGYEKETEFQRIKERYALLRKDFIQQKIVGTVRFWQPNAETDYFNFAQFCQNSPLKMIYNPQSGSIISSGVETAYVEGTTLYLPSKYLSYDNYYRDGYITKIEKSDGVGDSLTVTIEFTATTPWYKQISQYNLGGDSQGSKKYDYKYPYNYGGGVTNTVTVDSDSRQLSPVKVVIIGKATNPSWSHYVNGVLVSSGKVNGIVLPGHRLVIDTTSIPYSIKEFDMYGNYVADMYQQSDFETERFVRLQYGTNMISVSSEEENEIGIGVEAQIEYATV